MDFGETYTAEDPVLQPRYTTVEELFWWEILFIKICGGYPFEIRAPLALIYSFAAVLLNRLLVYLVQTKYYRLSVILPRATTQNLKMFGISTQILINLSTTALIFAAIRYRRLIMVIVRKRLDVRYLDRRPYRADNNGTSGIGASKLIMAKRLMRYNLVFTIVSLLCRELQYLNYFYIAPTKIAPLPKVHPERQLELNPNQTWGNLFFGLVCIVQGSLEVNQVYGLIHIILMITTTITDMLRYALEHDRLGPNTELTNKASNSTKMMGPARRPLLTSELMMQARDTLLTIRVVVSFACLLVLLSELARLMLIVCLLNGALSSGHVILAFETLLEYGRLSSTIVLGRLGYHWLHQEVQQLKGLIEQANMFRADSISQLSRPGKVQSISTIERVTICRMADNICSIWPTDWYVPDLKTFLQHNIFVVTFVLTLDQLVDVGFRMQTNHA